jgi:hypothetical protein
LRLICTDFIKICNINRPIWNGWPKFVTACNRVIIKHRKSGHYLFGFMHSLHSTLKYIYFFFISILTCQCELLWRRNIQVGRVVKSFCINYLGMTMTKWVVTMLNWMDHDRQKCHFNWNIVVLERRYIARKRGQNIFILIIGHVEGKFMIY